MLGVTDLPTYLVALVLIILLPGPNSLYVLSVAAQRGVRPGYQGAMGILVGDALLMTAAAIGGAALLMSSPDVFFVMKVVGAAYLAWMGLQLLMGAWRAWFRPSSVASMSTKPVDDKNPFTRAMVVSLLNPKAIMFLLSFYIQFVDPTYPHPAVPFVVLGAIGELFSFIYLSILIFAGARLANAFRARRRTSSVATAGVGAAFIGFGAKLATTSMQ